jgi:hypothetical protein
MAAKEYTEHYIQAACVQWLQLAHPEFSPLFFAVPNGAKTKLTEARWMKAEGMKKGVADTILLVAAPPCSFICIEFKTPTGVQSQEQADFQRCVEAAGGSYVVCRSVEQFRQVVTDYLARVPDDIRASLLELREERKRRAVQQARAEYNKLKTKTHERSKITPC